MFSQIIVRVIPGEFKNRILNFIDSFSDAVFLDSNEAASGEIPFTGTKYSYIAAAGISDVIHAENNRPEYLQYFIESQREKGNWVFGFLSYDLKNEFESLVSDNPDHIGFPLFHFFAAQHVFIAEKDTITIISNEDPELLWKKIYDHKEVTSSRETASVTRISHVPARDNYLKAVEKLLHHIRIGDIYEINYCHEILGEAKNLNPIEVFMRMAAISPSPFACYYRTRGLHLLCASPERFLAKRDSLLIAQPIKGTAARGINSAGDQLNRSLLSESEKERSENIMIVDLVRNDLSKVAMKGSVRVEELCGVYTFPKVHQMISTISCHLQPGKCFLDIIRALFPMGSMTGAPKISAMQLIDQHENFKRSLFSGTVGYISPDGEFDFNVVIRSILFNKSTGVVSVSAGSAITAVSDPEKEYLETLVKLSPQLEALGVEADQLIKEIYHGNPV